jgi:hypothetical protein
LVESEGALEGWIFVSLAAGRVEGTVALSLVGWPEVEGVIVRCFIATRRCF